MFADVNKMGRVFLLLTQAKNDAEYAAELQDYDGEETGLLECYVLATDADGMDCIYANREELGELVAVEVETVMMYGDEYDRRCWGSMALAYEDEQGRIWLDEQMHDEVFC